MLTAVFFAAWCAVSASAVDDDYPKNNFDLFPELPEGVMDTTNFVCREHSRLYLDHLKNMSLWAYEMHDATAKSVTGILRGSISQFGQFEECFTSKSPYPTQYCLTTVKANVPKADPPRDPKSLTYGANEMVLRKLYDKHDPSQQPENVVLLGWCVPASCTPKDLQNYLNKYLDKVDFPLKKKNVTYSSYIDENSCQREDEKSRYDHVDVAFCLVVGIIAILVVLSTAYDILRNDTEDKLKNRAPLTLLASSFSLKNNYRRLPKADGSNPALNILYGMRVFCILMIIIDHRFGTHLSSGVLNFDKVEDQYRSAVGSIFFHGDLFVDSFFILSGLLVTYCLLVHYDKKVTNPLLIIFLRYMRLTPIYAFVIFYYATLLDHSGMGPMWKLIVSSEVQDCRANWWTNLLYISNYVNSDHMCMVHSWYLPCDFHYFILAVFLCIAMQRYKKAGLVLLSATTLLSILIPFVIGLVYMRPAVLFFYPEFLRGPKVHPDFILTYSKSHARAAPYFIGMIAGYLFYRMKGSEKCLKQNYSYIIFTASLALMITTLLTGTIFYNPYYVYNAVESSIYAALHRTLWAVGSIGILYVASYGHAKFVYKFLSWKPWIPLSKLVYGAYLVHMQFQLRAVARKGGADAVTYFDVISFALSDICLAFGTAFILYLTIEAPFRNVFALLFSPPKEPSKSKSPDAEESTSEATCDSHL
ncbi:hypothetical protein NQ315_009727 [Exocentrus adspersus]|uniref:Nose resistant-to-fluoxetine protein N-terminal domain-containing protein n=1 Tax=Exocentrus adspersus TaxID=1586481 RepID=A0AAV8WI75_9CUCU|nr:hypothetical protein NQ315_009727 [Exocentrus adspersus]